MKKVYLTIWTIALIVFCSYMKIHALTLTQDVEVFDSKVIDFTNTDLTSEILYKRKFITSNTQQQQYYAWNVSGYNYEDQINYIEIPIMFSWTNNAQSNTTNSIEFCDRWKWRTIDSNNQVLEWGCEHVYYYDFVDKEYLPNNTPSGLQFGFYAHNTDGGYSMCQIQENYLVCPTRQRTIDFIGMLYDFRNSGSSQINMYVSLGTVWNRYQAQSVTSAINSQTQQQQQQYEQATNGTWKPSNDINTNQNGANETIEWGQQEEALLDSLDMNTTMLSDITINPTASAFIWDIVGGLRNMNPAIVMIMTSILGLGIAKMLLNR